MAATVKDLIGTAQKAASNQATAQAVNKSTAAQIAAQRGATARPATIPAGGQNESQK